MPPNRLGYDRDGHDFEAVQPSDMRQVAKAIDAIGEGDKREGRRHRKAKPCRQSAREAGTQHAEDNADLAARGAGQKLAERDDVAVDRFIQLFAALDEFGAEIAKMRDRPAEARLSQQFHIEIIANQRLLHYRMMF